MTTTDTTSSTVSERPAWEVLEDGTVWPVQVLTARRSMFGYWGCRRHDGSVVNVYGPNLRSAANLDITYR